MLETLRIGYERSKVWATERVEQFDVKGKQVREIGYLNALSDNARRCDCWGHFTLVTRAARCGGRRESPH